MDEPLFGFDPYHMLLASLGAALLLAQWLPRLAFRRPPAVSALLMLFGMLGYGFAPDLIAGIDPTTNPAIWERTAELVVIVVLFSTGLRIDDIGGYRHWRPTIRMLAVTMPLTIAAVMLLGWALAGMTLAGAMLLGAVLAPTDPVLAGDVQVGPPLEGGEHPLRFTLTTEAGLNDGLAFPFVYLALHLASGGLDASGWIGWIGWIGWDVVWRITVGVAVGGALGWVLGRILFAAPTGSSLAESGSGVLALASVFLCYGAAELLEGYGFIAAFVAGLAVRRAEEGHSYHQRLHAFCDSIEDALTAILLVFLGSVMPLLWPFLDWRHALIGLGLLIVIRPLAGLIGLIGTGRPLAERGVIAFYGVRGIGSVYYLGYASAHIEFANEGAIWAVVVFTIFVSTILHGFTAPEVVRRSTADAQGES